MNTLEYFYELCKIPRSSGNEEGVRLYLLSWAKNNGFECLTDKIGNVVIRIPATKGYENVKSIALQGHMDMVCVKTPESNHDFAKNPIQTYIDGDFLKAKDTSLGGDDGIAIAIIMSLFTDRSVSHGPLEAIFTVSEETSLLGANNLDPSMIRSRRLINIDSDEEGIIYIGCAGGIDVKVEKAFEEITVPSNWIKKRITLSGLLGGHSGSEIHKNRLNAIKLISYFISEIGSFVISSASGGTRLNVIPSSASADIAVPSEEHLNKLITSFFEFKNSSKNMESEISLKVEDISFENSLSESDSTILIKALSNCPYGVHSWSKITDNVVETSNNLSIVNLNHGFVRIDLSCRSLINDQKILIAEKIREHFKAHGYKVEFYGSYPSWTPNNNSALLRLCKNKWKELTGVEPTVTSIHAGLECGIINDKISGMDSLSIGPNLYDIHSVNEKLSLSSVDRIFNYIRLIIESGD